jgi:phosphoesterase RecJ-like protein
MTSYDIQYNAVVSALNKANRVATVSHRRPDADTLGAALALADLLEKKGKSVVCFSSDQVPRSLARLPDSHKFTADSAVFANVDVIVVLDASDLKFAGVDALIPTLSPRPLIINIDHHGANECFGDINLVIPTAASATEIVFGIYECFGDVASPAAATNMLAGVIHDTMMFFNPATTAASLGTASRLEALGADRNFVSRLVVRNKSVESLSLWGKALERLKYDPEAGRASTVLYAEETSNLSGDEDALGGLSNFLNSVLPARIVVVLRENADGTIKGSLRTAREDTDVAAEALRWGGGGHRKAAGFVVKGRIVEMENEWSVVVD